MINIRAHDTIDANAKPGGAGPGRVYGIMSSNIYHRLEYVIRLEYVSRLEYVIRLEYFIRLEYCTGGRIVAGRNSSGVALPKRQPQRAP